ncbi:ribbon-helix-helix domain-containing protein [Streptomyces sp. APSN-46.1]|uniref:ribbon-helix-helix domain-containing protein n=1 Tax=Streptomyces sp. APSN-46.1 TaxID=2929049 RepID=UPI001FB348EB|nr:ribbon-helix-helix domain-containing protein [Streptomyces sp. APSN-46.1]MCJ1677309.1 ribbon-helix-helix domain-containing protein [Streptomyces sp. APSN-46.1]
MRIGLSLPVEDIEFLDRYAEREGIPSRSAVLRIAIGLLRERDVGRSPDLAAERGDAGGRDHQVLGEAHREGGASVGGP